MIDTYTVAERLYTVYCQSVGGKAFNGDPTKEKQSKSWLDAADAAIDLSLS